MTIRNQLDRIEDKLDEYSKNTIRNSQDIEWLKGGVRLIVPIIISLMSFMAYELYKQITIPKDEITIERKDDGRKEE